VRSYFSSDERRKVGPLLREAKSIDHVVCHHGLEAAVLERRLIRTLRPRYNSQGRRPATSFLKLTLGQPYPRLSVARTAGRDGLCLGPLSSSRLAKLAAEAVESVIPLRRCPTRLGAGGTPVRAAPCAPAQLGVSACPCAGGIDDDTYRTFVDRATAALTTDPDLVLGPLRFRLLALAAAQRFEEAADVRDRAEALTSLLRRQRRLDLLADSGRVVIEVPGGGAELDGGVVVRSWGSSSTKAASDRVLDLSPAPEPPRPDRRALDADTADEIAVVGSWLDANAHRVRLISVEEPLVSPLPALPSFAPVRAGR
jgi:DNA polymerase-3 subunit epsilon